MQSMFFSLEMQNGYLYLQYDFGFSTGPVILEDSMKKALINDAKFHEVNYLIIYISLYLVQPLQNMQIPKEWI